MRIDLKKSDMKVCPIKDKLPPRKSHQKVSKVFRRGTFQTLFPEYTLGTL